MANRALVVGATGIIGASLAEQLQNAGWDITGIARGVLPNNQNIKVIEADLTSEASLREGLAGQAFTHVFFTSWVRCDNEEDNIRVNGKFVSDVLDILGPAKSLRHVGLVTGLKYYLGPFESYSRGIVPMTPFREDLGRQADNNFYYEQEDRLIEAASKYGFTYSVHVPHTAIGYAIGNQMNIGVTLAVYASLCKHTGAPFVFPGSKVQWNGLTDMTDVRLLAKHLQWAAETPAAQNQLLNIVNGDVFRWKWMWQQIAQYFGVEPIPFADEPRPLQPRLATEEAAAQWKALAQRFALREPSLSKLTSAWHTDADLGRPAECLTDMSKNRAAGFNEFQETRSAFFDLFDRLKREKIIPE
jgi:nucleoside-diphosphate-sugar epimerase